MPSRVSFSSSHCGGQAQQGPAGPSGGALWGIWAEHGRGPWVGRREVSGPSPAVQPATRGRILTVRTKKDGHVLDFPENHFSSFVFISSHDMFLKKKMYFFTHFAEHSLSSTVPPRVVGGCRLARQVNNGDKMRHVFHELKKLCCCYGVTPTGYKFFGQPGQGRWHVVLLAVMAMQLAAAATSEL